MKIIIESKNNDEIQGCKCYVIYEKSIFKSYYVVTFGTEKDGDLLTDYNTRKNALKAIKSFRKDGNYNITIERN